MPDFDIELVKTTRLYGTDKKQKQAKPQMNTMKTVEINEESTTNAEAKAIYGGAASGSGVKVATRDELKESMGLEGKSEGKKINLFKKRHKSPKGPLIHKPAPVDERLILEPVLKEKQRKEMKNKQRSQQKDIRNRDQFKSYEDRQQEITAKIQRSLNES